MWFDGGNFFIHDRPGDVERWVANRLMARVRDATAAAVSHL
jgi:hypothetical protein